MLLGEDRGQGSVDRGGGGELITIRVRSWQGTHRVELPSRAPLHVLRDQIARVLNMQKEAIRLCRDPRGCFLLDDLGASLAAERIVHGSQLFLLKPPAIDIPATLADLSDTKHASASNERDSPVCALEENLRRSSSNHSYTPLAHAEDVPRALTNGSDPPADVLKALSDASDPPEDVFKAFRDASDPPEDMLEAFTDGSGPPEFVWPYDAEPESATGDTLEDLLEPHPDVHALFMYYNELYFQNVLGPVSVQWSTRMTLCAGLCEFQRLSNSCTIKLSEPLLKYRPVSDLKNTLLHEMIHAFLFLAGGKTDRDGHGGDFTEVMNRINSSMVEDHQRPKAGYKITVYHTFVDEVDHYRTHVWRCAMCSNLIKRSMNRVPSEKDCRFYRTDSAKRVPCPDPNCGWHKHQRTCGGVYEKIAEPAPKKRATKQIKGLGWSKISNFFVSDENAEGRNVSKRPRHHDSPHIPSSGSTAVSDALVTYSLLSVRCPVCEKELSGTEAEINRHVDECLNGDPCDDQQGVQRSSNTSASTWSRVDVVRSSRTAEDVIVIDDDCS